MPARKRIVRTVFASLSVVALLLSVAAAPVSAADTSGALTETFTGTVDAGGTKYRAHKIEVGAAGTISASLDWGDAGANLNMLLKDPSGTKVATAATHNKPETLTYEATQTGTWTLGVWAGSGASSYTLTVTHPGPALVAAGPLSFSAQFGYRGHAGLYAYGMDWDQTDDTLLVGDIWNYRVHRFTTGGRKIATVSKMAPAGATGGILDPFDVEADASGHVWVANQAQSRVVEFDHDGNWLQTIGLGGSTHYDRGCGAGKMYWPTNLLVHRGGDGVKKLYVSDPYCRNVYVYRADNGQFLFAFDFNLSDLGIYNPMPRGIDVDSAGRIHVVEHNSRRVITFNQQGQRVAYSARQSDMNDPRGMAIGSDSGGNEFIIVVGAFNNEVFKFNLAAASSTVTFAKKWNSSNGTRLDSVRYPAVDGRGNIYVGDTWGYRVWKFDPNGAPLSWEQPPLPPPNGGNNQVNGIGIDPGTNRLFTADTFENRAQRYATRQSSGATWWCKSPSDCPAWELQFGSREAPRTNSPGFNYPRGLTVGGSSVWIDAGQAVVRYDLNGNFLERWGGVGSAPGNFIGGPKGIDVIHNPSTGNDPATNNGRVYTTDSGNCRLQVFDFHGTLLSYMGSCSSTSTPGPNQMGNPWQVAVRGDTAYVADAKHSQIAVWDVSSKTLVQRLRPAPGGVAIKAPRGVMIDPTGSWIYIGDTGNRRIVRVSASDPSVSQVVATGADVPGGLGGPKYLEFSPDGRLFTSDNSQRILAFTVNG